MARPRKEGMDYFPHDTDAANDKKIKALRMLYGNDGYTFYFVLLEMIYREPSFELDISDAETIQILSKECGINEELFNQILKTAMKRDCFDRESYYERAVLTSNGIKKRASVVVDKRVRMQEKHAKKVSDAETTPEMPQSKVKEKESKSKVKVIKTLYGEHVLLTDEQYQKLINDLSEPDVTKLIEDINYWFTQNPSRIKNYKDHNLMIRKWHKNNNEKKLTVIGGGNSGKFGKGNERSLATNGYDKSELESLYVGSPVRVQQV